MKANTVDLTGYFLILPTIHIQPTIHMVCPSQTISILFHTQKAISFCSWFSIQYSTSNLYIYRLLYYAQPQDTYGVQLTKSNQISMQNHITSTKGNSILTTSSAFSTGVCKAVSTSKIPCRSPLTPSAQPSQNTVLSFSGR